ncbi:MAG: HAD family hydrolase [Theionarchaea archaeon]|nr:HAD family hydrolase [Theionarchaea archaeon]
MVQAVTFDLWGTLILDVDGYNQRIEEKREELLLRELDGVSRETLSEAMNRSWHIIEETRSTLRDVPTSQQIIILASILGVDTDLEKAYSQAVLHLPPPLNPHAREVLSHLDVKIGLISNTGRTPGSVIRLLLSTMGILHYFHTTLFSNEVGYLKPHPEIFTQASRKLHVPLSQILHVGDDPVTDIEGAGALGMKTLHMIHPADLKKVMELVT